MELGSEEVLKKSTDDDSVENNPQIKNLREATINFLGLDLVLLEMMFALIATQLEKRFAWKK